MASFVNSSLSSSPFFIRCQWSPIQCQRRVDLFNRSWRRRLLVLPLKCSSSPQDSEAEVETTISFPSSSGDFNHKLITGIGGIGFLETAYLTFLKLTNSEPFCSIGGGTCRDILNSDYALVFGVPLPLIGMVTYGLVAALGLQLAGKNLPFGISKSNAQIVLLGSTTSLAAASACFLYILSTKFSGSSCSYCLLSALSSFSLFIITVKDIGWQKVQKEVGLQLLIASIVIITLNASYSNSKSVSSSSIDLPYYATEITTPSSPFALSLTRHLNSIGAKLYGAFWCSHCLEQKEMFGREAAKLLNYVECFPEGFRTGTKMDKACSGVKIEGFPAWVINGQVLSGEMELSELAIVSGFNESLEFQQGSD